jgi:uncharacterized protein (DUF2147 family)
MAPNLLPISARVAGGLVLMSLALAGSAHAAAADGIVGTWLTPEQDSKITIEPCGDAYCGHISWLKAPLDDKGQPKVDINNKKDELKSRPILGMPMISGLKPNADGGWEDGTIYNPRDGATYASKASLDGDVLKVKGCVLFFCKAQDWTRTTAP